MVLPSFLDFVQWNSKINLTWNILNTSGTTTNVLIIKGWFIKDDNRPIRQMPYVVSVFQLSLVVQVHNNFKQVD